MAIPFITALKQFTEDLWREFGKNKGQEKSLALYMRILSGEMSSESVTKIIQGFDKFYNKHQSILLEGSLDGVNQGEYICFGTNKNISIPIQKYIHKSNHDTREVIRKHILTIKALINPNNDCVLALGKNFDAFGIDTSTKEGKLMSNVMASVTEFGQDFGNVSNPMVMMTAMAQSGVLNDFMEGVKSGNLDYMNMVHCAMPFIDKLDEETKAKVNAVATLVKHKTQPRTDIDEVD